MAEAREDFDLERRDDAAHLSSRALEPEAPEPVYVMDTDPGIRRVRAGKGFSYRGPDGKRVADAKVIRRIKSLAVPPAYEDVWICLDPLGHIQATGRDARGRKQYRYHPRWLEIRDAVKYEGLVAFGRTLPRLRRRFAEDMGARGLVRDRVLATVASLLDRTLIRIGNPGYARDNKSFGLSTLRDRHVDVAGSEIRFRFTGKSGRDWDLRVTDRRIARIVRSCQELPGQHLFQYRDDDGERRAVTSDGINAYLRAVGGRECTAKQFRTWAGTVMTAMILAEEEAPTSKRQAARTINAAIDTVAATLGNTRAICRRCYVHPLVIERYEAGALATELKDARPRARRRSDAYGPEEALVLAWLEAQVAERGGR
ncbi:DNA topoisomerase IB [Marinivivus vitaminiproducens]|uniref:DNA topoisomerase IB n=1 Tax=Marinivivus vitaminiproducens TaxID=3035935 RepID=UPI0027A2431B|nr:DNA topoisomerase IB [Geminicoccaceae bacterium SCSIO 64248]